MSRTNGKKHPRHSFARTAGHLVLGLVSSVGAFVLVLVGMLLAYSPGKPAPFVDENGDPLPGRLSEKAFVTINGVQQGMFIKSRDIRNPVLLFLHGGPGTLIPS